jgi:hypothetical protein
MQASTVSRLPSSGGNLPSTSSAAVPLRHEPPRALAAPLTANFLPWTHPPTVAPEALSQNFLALPICLPQVDLLAAAKWISVAPPLKPPTCRPEGGR